VQDVAGVARLPCLSELALKSNPFSRDAGAGGSHRVPVLNLFREQRAAAGDVAA
jgi:hypothetical protein